MIVTDRDRIREENEEKPTEREGDRAREGGCKMG